MGDEKLRDLARVLGQRVKSNTSIDWTIKESVRSKLKVIVKRLLRQYGYPPDKQLLATENVLKQAELLADEWAALRPRIITIAWRLRFHSLSQAKGELVKTFKFDVFS